MSHWDKFLKTGSIKDYLKYKEEFAKDKNIKGKQNEKGSNNTKKS